MKRILLHICCAGCACYPYQKLKEEGFEVVGFWYNPNIQPYEEYRRRLMATGYFAQATSLKLITDTDYPLKNFLKGILAKEEAKEVRCSFCYEMRMERAARSAKERGFDYFTTTLLYSKFQQHNLIKELGEKLGEKYDVNFYYEDFREGWKEGITLSKKMGLYRQQYCGCIFSEKERYSEYTL
ncbi:MAG: epoxyqueuosine reductase QueH [Candidatus Omnitrophica bacterium]|nr:epoxyqueuosine reductase QueH [Candidatus Omnitrophota bacterium]